MKINAQAFLWGFVAALTAIVVELLLYVVINTTASSQTTGNLGFLKFSPYILLFAFIEELSKFVIIVKVIEPLSHSFRKCIINALLMGSGFGILELFFAYTQDPNGILSFNSFAIGLLHIGTAGILATMYSRNPKHPIAYSISALVLTTTIHTIFNSLSQEAGTANTTSAIALLIALGMYISFSLIGSKKNLHSI